MGKGDFREASKAKLLKVGLELKMLRMDSNENNTRHWGVVVDDKGKVIEGGIREAVRRGVVTEENHWHWWGLRKRANGDMDDYWNKYGELNDVYGRIVDGVVVPA